MRLLISFMFLIMLFNSIIFSQSHLDYKKRGGDPPNRMEGVKPMNIGGLDLELLSFTGYVEPVKENRNVEYKIRFYLRSDSIVRITAQELNPVYYYWMESLKKDWKKGWNEFSPWQMADVLNPLNLSLGSLGIRARFQDQRIETEDVVPLIVYHSTPPTNIQGYTLHFRPGRNFIRMQYLIIRLADSTVIFKQNVPSVFANNAFSINFMLENERSGQLVFSIMGEYEFESGRLRRTYKFYHNPIIID